MSVRTDLLGALRERLAAAPDADRLRPLGLGRLISGPDALAELPAAVAALVPAGAEVALLADRTPMRRGGEDLKPAVRALLEADFEVRPVETGPAAGDVHADEETLAALTAAAAGVAAIITVASGTVADLGKALAAAHRLPHLIVQTAASVNGFADDQSVLLRSGVKRTVPSRWPDVLLLDGPTLLAAPRPMSLAGLGDLVAMFTATPDWLLASAAGMDGSYSPTAVAIGRDHGEELLELAPRLAHDDAAAVVRLAEILAVSGISMGVAGRTAPSSGMEHTVSHLIEMAAASRGEGTALHGAKVGVTTIVAALVWERLRARIEANGLEPRFPGPEAMEERVRAAFDPLDPSGAMAAECWSDYARKLERWRASRPRLERLAREWGELQPRLDELTVDPARLVAAMRAAGAPTRFGELAPAVDPDTARWALANCHLMRDRFTVADLACFSGGWEEADVEAVLSDAAALGAGL